MTLKSDKELVKPTPDKVAGYSQAVNEIKEAMDNGKKQLYSKEAMANHDCLGEGCGVCGMAEAKYRAGIIAGARMGAKYPDVDWGQVE